MDPLFFLPIIFFVAVLAFAAGQSLKEYPSEEEMLRRIIQSRVHKRIEAEVEASIADEINRQAAHS